MTNIVRALIHSVQAIMAKINMNSSTKMPSINKVPRSSGDICLALMEAANSAAAGITQDRDQAAQQNRHEPCRPLTEVAVKGTVQLRAEACRHAARRRGGSKGAARADLADAVLRSGRSRRSKWIRVLGGRGRVVHRRRLSGWQGRKVSPLLRLHSRRAVGTVISLGKPRS